MHQNLGHPPSKETPSHRRSAVIQAAEQLKCGTCEKSSKAKIQKVSSPVIYLNFNEAIAADILWIDTVDAKNKPCLNIVDLASTYQIVVPLNHQVRRGSSGICRSMDPVGWSPQAPAD